MSWYKSYSFLSKDSKISVTLGWKARNIIFFENFLQIPEIPARDQLAMDLAEKASKAHRDKKEKALKSVQARLAS